MAGISADVVITKADQFTEAAQITDVAGFYVEIGHARRLDSKFVFQGAAALAGALALAGQPGQSAKVTVMVDGFDDDPRELFQIPKAKRFIVQVMAELGIRSLDNPDVCKFDHGTLGLSAACGVFGPPPPIFVVPKLPVA